MKTLSVFILFFFCSDIYISYSQSLYNSTGTTVSPLEVVISNRGKLFNNEIGGTSGFHYPRGSQNQYIFGGGLWFGALKRVEGDLKKLVTISYNPNSGVSWMTPGNTEDGESTKEEDYPKYGIERSTDYNSDGSKKGDGIAWSLWKKEEGIGNTGNYVSSISERNSVVYPKGAAFYSDEMFHSRYKDTDLARYEGGPVNRKQAGYPLGLQFDERVFTWKNGTLQTTLIIQNTITNTSNDTLYDCWVTQITDPDIGIGHTAGNNDYAKYFNDGNAEGVYMWTGTNNGEAGKGFHYLGMTLLESPAIVPNDPMRTLRQTESAVPYNEQIGITTAQMGVVVEDPLKDEERYNYISQGVIDLLVENKDFRLLTASGAFTMLPGQSLRFAYSFSIAPPTVAPEADSTVENSAGIRQLLRNVRDYYYSGLTTDIEENTYNESHYRIMPNPAHSNIAISGFNGNENISEISLVDFIGAVYPLEYSLNNNSVYASVQNIASGYYSLIIKKNGKVEHLPLYIIR